MTTSAFDQYAYMRRRGPLFRGLALSMVLHLLLFAGMLRALWEVIEPPRPAVVYNVQLDGNIGNPAPEPTPPVPEPPKPEPEPAPDPPKPEPKPPEPEPEPEKEPMAEAVPATGACCMADGSCQELTREACRAAKGKYQGDDTDCASGVCEELKKKEEEKKQKAEAEKKKKEEEKKKKEEEKKKKEEEAKKEKPKPVQEKKDPATRMADAPPTPKPGVAGTEVVDPALLSWINRVRAKVERAWVQPGGVSLALENPTAEISFWVSRDGTLMMPPAVGKPSSAEAIDKSGLEAIKAAAPYPPLPEGYVRPEVQVIFTFTVQQ